MYLAAKRATLMEKGVLNRGGTNEQIEPEVDKVCYIHFYISTCLTFIGKEKNYFSAIYRRLTELRTS